MKHVFAILLLFAAITFGNSQSQNAVFTNLRAEVGFRIGSTTSQKITGFDLVFPAIATDGKVPTTKAVKDYLIGSCVLSGSTAGGDLSGSFPNPTVAKLNGTSVSGVTPTTGQVLKYNGTAWAAGAEADPSITNELQTISVSGGNITLSNGGGTIAAPTDGNGIYGGSGTVPAGTVATATTNVKITTSQGASVFLDEKNATISTANKTDEDSGSIGITAGSATNATGGQINFGAGNAPNGIGGDINFSAGSGSQGGVIYFTGGPSADLDEGGEVTLLGGVGRNGRGNVRVSSSMLLLEPMTEAQRNAITPTAGQICFNSDAGKMQCYDGTTWNNLW